MKKVFQTLMSIAAVAATFVSCNKVENNKTESDLVYFDLKAAEVNTKVSLSENDNVFSPSWEGTEKLSVYFKFSYPNSGNKKNNPEAVFNASGSGKTATFSGTATPGNATSLIGVINPSETAITWSTDHNLVGFDVSSIQKPSTLNSVPGDILISKRAGFTVLDGVASTDDLYFKRLTSTIKLSFDFPKDNDIIGETIEEVRISSSNKELTGRVVANLETESYEKTNALPSVKDVCVDLSEVNVKAGDNKSMFVSVAPSTIEDIKFVIKTPSYIVTKTVSDISVKFDSGKLYPITLDLTPVEDSCIYEERGEEPEEPEEPENPEITLPATATMLFGTNNIKIDQASVQASDSHGRTWTITTVGTTSYTPNKDYYQVGSSSKPATSITFTTTLPKNYKISSMSAKFGGFSSTAGNIELKVGQTTVGTGSLDATNDVTVTSTSEAEGNVLTITVTGIAKGVKVYNISYTYDNVATN